jgi:CRP-like cAMP-binding protein
MNALRQHIEQIVPLTDEEFELIASKSAVRKIKKHQFILQEGTISTADHFVLKGSFRQYYLDEKGKERIVQFAFANWWTGDWYSILNHTPSEYNIEALTDGEIAQISKESFDFLFAAIPKLEKYFRIMFQKGFVAQQRRITSLQKPAEERYRDFLATYQHFEQEVSQAHIASYLGITRESLNRIKNQRNAG